MKIKCDNCDKNAVHVVLNDKKETMYYIMLEEQREKYPSKIIKRIEWDLLCENCPISQDSYSFKLSEIDTYEKLVTKLLWFYEDGHWRKISSTKSTRIVEKAKEQLNLLLFKSK